MKSGQLDFPKSKPRIMKNLPKPFRVLLFVFAGIVLLISSLIVGRFVYCDTVAICEGARPTMSSEMIATQMPIQFYYAIKDIDAGRYKNAQQRLEYIIARDPEYPGAKEKLAEVENLLKVTPTP